MKNMTLLDIGNTETEDGKEICDPAKRILRDCDDVVGADTAITMRVRTA